MTACSDRAGEQPRPADRFQEHAWSEEGWREPNKEESRIPSYSLPELLRFSDGSRVSTPAAWRHRRQELLELYRGQVYGRPPDSPVRQEFEILREDPAALGGRALRRETRIRLNTDRGERSLYLLLFLPAEASGPVPVFLGLNYFGNQAVHSDPAIRISNATAPAVRGMGIVDGRATEASRGARAGQWSVEQILDHGFGVATMHYSDIAPDTAETAGDGVAALFDEAGEARPTWGAIGRWAWGMSRGLDYLETVAQVDAGRVIALGHSRLGKAALWAAAQDERFAGAVASSSGHAGAALFRRRLGETIWHLDRRFAYWFAPEFGNWADREDELPVDQHMLLALIAPRPLFLATARDDLWSDPRGEYEAARAASPAFRLLGAPGLPGDGFPEAGETVGGNPAFYTRAGSHDVTPEDWERFLEFAAAHFATDGPVR